MDQYLINLLSYSIFRYSLWRIAEYSLQRFTKNENNFSYITWPRQPFVFFWSVLCFCFVFGYVFTAVRDEYRLG